VAFLLVRWRILAREPLSQKAESGALGGVGLGLACRGWPCVSWSLPFLIGLAADDVRWRGPFGSFFCPMSASDEIEAAAAGEPVQVAARDLLGQVFFWGHFAVMIYIVLGWAVPLRAALFFYELFLPAVAIQWLFNANSCVLNNLESFIRSGRWRDPSNSEEGAWLLTLVRGWLGLGVTQLQMDVFTYAVLILLWSLGLWRLIG
jgi:hypothetical protein